ncbi:hypothetical protein H2O64_04660 [Kordia sp. YSTF-M3]|uniref:DUF4296 domain-containing protein n=1 Tax=Kordia aestuariivivens TaxID=2759037 RepID=A0ABR7Q5W6_9FLAO|nr:hypothetical protein [Kordia aestuariivivens]MBC8753950.1 hypothetical protein [Kordia aestuariivivens]
MKISYILLFLFIITSCKSYEPFVSRKAKKENIKHLKKTLDLSKKQFLQLANNDSILYSISKSLKNKKVAKRKVEKRLDSFFYGKYDIDELSIMLELDRNFPEMEFNFEKDNSRKRLEFKNLSELKKFMKKIDSSFKKEIIIVTDSTKKKKQKQ